ncbi:OsmC family protein [Luteipulveratus mongoliensis]|uniref:Osmotically inducible protein OsmC n=1 Tax=Luteipulveratus mongoliensis TaxID=571913 RepID=A0A0K1JF02_9MICO|nr:OsmC family protein [Luteipulveratus mongoliensis]AKU15180.1 osmotically inducible protein OsmC [Luteipulveratus mongoliensis]
MTGSLHTYAAHLTWSGSTGVGYDAYDRAHDVTAAPAEQALSLTSDPAFLGNPALLNPEQLLVMAASSCQLLSFLSVAARSRLDVVDYADEATATMDESQTPTRLDAIDLRPRIVLADTDRPRAAQDRLDRLVDLAHRGCYIANSLSTPVRVTATFTWRTA